MSKQRKRPMRWRLVGVGLTNERWQSELRRGSVLLAVCWYEGGWHKWRADSPAHGAGRETTESAAKAAAVAWVKAQEAAK